MEKMLTVEERIKKAEEIYNKRKNSNINTYNITDNSKKISLSLFKKMFLQILACIVIYSAFYFVKNKNYIFSETVISKTSDILKYDINFTNIYNISIEYIKEKIDKYNIKVTDNSINEKDNEEKNNEINNEINNEASVSGKGGGEKNEKKEKKESKTQMEIDAEYVSNNVSLINPVEGVVTSKFRKKRTK